MSSYVVDENVVLNATHGEKPKTKEPATAEKVFLYKIFRGKDHLFINQKIKKKFIDMPKKIASRYKSEFLDNHVVPMFLKLIHDSVRTTMIDGIKTNFKGVKECDTEFVGVAIQSNGTLVTADGDLKTAISKDSSVSKCVCKTVEEVINSP